MTTRKEQARASRAALLDAARECFATWGYEATTVAAILDRAGMARGALYHYFPGGKREVFAAVFDTVNEDFHRRRDAVGGLATPLARVGAATRTFLDRCTSDEFARIVLADAPWIIPGQGAGDRGSTFRGLRAQLAKARAAGDLAPVDVDAAAVAVYGAVRAAGELVAGAPAPDRAAVAATAAEALDLLVGGLTAR
jgi:AcrR family transcriptional regulator